MNRILLIFALAIFAIAQAYAEETSTIAPPLDAAQVFEWWDDGIITPAEADEIFSRLEEENYDEACLLAEVYAQEPCANFNKTTEKKPRKKRKSKTAESAQSAKTTPPPSIIPHGHFTWKGQYDSDGHLKKHREELQVQFYYFRLRLGSQELLSYRRDSYEAHFGQISTLEFHSHLPLDTLWGATVLYPVGKFRLGAHLDTSKAFHAGLDFHPNRTNQISALFWKFPNATAIALQAHTTLGQISSWYQFGQDLPLIKIQLQNQGDRISWKTTAYIHGDSIPQGLNLSKIIAENRLWASQTINVQWPEVYSTVFSIKARVLSPIASDSVNARFKATLTSGPDRFRPSLSATCIEASENCDRTEWNGSIESTWESFTLKASAKVRREDSRTKTPKIELGAGYHSNNALAKLTIAFPQTNPAKSISVQNEIKLNSDWLGCDLVFAFKKTRTKTFSPSYAHLQASLKF
ncbi:hypothetical protein [Fibrobacter sp. UWB12]|uniref:hypothetical protein n=1 Tax=Fibrobacter sp. UWB12 TaxID=1896203 RepID=UPI000913176C|nr:hypothetical protein [Fibrobacter sp. UWB12]SHK49174.1 hypothetical protein SAMN05720759_10381 [Fibrobacter sp. UWB12]